MSLARAYYEEGGTFDRVGAVLIKRMLFLGFWSTLLFFGPDGIRNLVDSFAALGASASGQALDSPCPGQGAIFLKFDGRHTLRKAALAAGLEPERANKVSAYDLRHSIATELTERSGDLVGVGYLPATNTSRPRTTTCMPVAKPPNRSFRDTDWDTKGWGTSVHCLVV